MTTLINLGTCALLTALLIFSSSGSVFTLLNDMDSSVFMPCNVLCSSNIVGAFLLSIYFRDEISQKELYYNISREKWLWMLVGSILYSVVGPFLYLTGLASTDVPTAAIIQRMESLNFLALSYFTLNSAVTKWTLVNSALTLCGIVLAVISPLFFGEEIELSTGSLLILLSGYAFSLSLLISKKYLSDIPIAILAVFRVVLGAILYHFLVMSLGEDLGVLYSTKLWAAMAPYGVVYVFLGQLAWLYALQKAIPLHISIGTTFLFILTLVWSGILLQVLPTKAQWIGSAFLFTSILSSVAEISHVAQNPAKCQDLATPIVDTPNPLAMDRHDPDTPQIDSEFSPVDLNGSIVARSLSCSAIKKRDSFSSGRDRVVSLGDFDSLASQGSALKGF